MGLYKKIGEVNVISNPQEEQVEMPPAIARTKPTKEDGLLDKPTKTNKPVEPVKSEKKEMPESMQVPEELDRLPEYVLDGDKSVNKILIGTTCYRTILVRTVQAIIDTLKKYPETEHAFQNGVFVHENANNLVELAKGKKASHIFFVEHDMAFEPDTLQKLLDLDKDVVAASYSGRKLPREPLVYQQNPDNKELYRMNYDIWPDKPFKCYGVPTGCTLVKMGVFEKIKKPYFFFEYTEEGKMKMSQDIYFSKKVNEAGLEVWCHPTLNVIHCGDFDY